MPDNVDIANNDYVGPEDCTGSIDQDARIQLEANLASGGV